MADDPRDADRQTGDRAISRADVSRDGDPMNPVGIVLRPATSADEPFLWDMLAAAIHTADGAGLSVAVVREIPALAHYVTGWGRAGDLGVIAEAEDGAPVGAAWLRLWTDDDYGYGFVDAATPELTMAVRQSRRGQGVGRRLLDALLIAARQAGYAAVSLSVDPGNEDALRLYRRAGFLDVGERGTSRVMLINNQVIALQSIP